MMIRAGFAKKKRLRYISHLELLDTMRRAIRRADIPGEYSRGYNPTLNLSLSQPLPVGMPGGSEYLDLNLKERIDGEKFVQDLNLYLPAGIEILRAKFVGHDNLKSLQALVDRARYIIDPPLKDEERGRDLLQAFAAKDELIITRKRRNKEDRDYDLRSMVHEIKMTPEGRWSFLVSTGSRGHVRPQEILQGLRKIESELPEVPIVNFYREGMYVSHMSQDDELLTPLAEEILEER